MWDTVADATGLDPVTVKSFLAFGMLLNNVAALDVDELDEPWAKGVRTRIHAGSVRAHHRGHQPMSRSRLARRRIPSTAYGFELGAGGTRRDRELQPADAVPAGV